MNFIDSVKKRFVSHTFFQSLGGFIIYKSGFGNRSLAEVNARYKITCELRKKFKKTLETSSVQKYNGENMQNTVWICWFQGIENAPQIIKDCYESVKYHIKDRNIVLIDQNNYSQYTELPQYIIEKWQKGIIPNALFSDLLRINLLNIHGGLWLDATVYLTDKLPDYIFSNDFFVYHNDWHDEEFFNMGNWFIYSEPNNVLLLETENLLFEYWKAYNYVKNYFIFHIFFKMVTEKYPDEWEKVPYYHQIDAHILSLEFWKKYDEKRFNQIKKLTSVHKLTHKTDIFNIEEESYISKLSELYKQ